MWEGVAHRAGLIFTWLSGVFLERASGDTTVPTFSQQGQDDTPPVVVLEGDAGSQSQPAVPWLRFPGEDKSGEEDPRGLQGR